MRKKIVLLLVVLAVLAIAFSVTAFAADDTAVTFTNYGLITAMFERLKVSTKAFFDAIDAIYLFFAKLGK